MALLVERIEEVRAQFEASDKGFEARREAWVALAVLAPLVDPANEDVALPLCRFTRQSLSVAGPWPTEAQPTLVALLPAAKRWMPVIEAEERIAQALAAHADALEKARAK